MDKTTNDNSKLVLTQQGGIVVTALATLALASIKIYSVMKSSTPTDTPES